ncbi:MAG: hypothetical protein HC767_02610 [Akkermansiaceae bacterium]|nr:hypothetical protein [Akkermansiaceae bacterium]
MNKEGAAEIGKAQVKKLASQYRATIQNYYNSGVREFDISNKAVDIIARNSLYYAQTHADSYKNMDYSAFMKHLGSDMGDSVFTEQWG